MTSPSFSGIASGSAAVVAQTRFSPGLNEEANHRIANNLQLVVAMISLEIVKVVDPVALATLEAMQRRIGAIASVHRSLCEAPTSDEIDFSSYLLDLGRNLETSCANASVGRRVVVDAAPARMSAEHAGLIGIIVSEVVANACKYAYPADAPGDIEIKLTGSRSSGLHLTVTDRGRGRVDVGSTYGAGLGSRLIATMARRLEAQHAWIDARPGTEFRLFLAAR